MNAPHWREHVLQTREVPLLWAEAGTAGPNKTSPVIWLHGGPGDEHRSLRSAAELLTDDCRCIVYDQRGSGGSSLEELDEETLAPERFVADLEALREHLQIERLALVGHSWGATLALLYGAAHPERIERIALIGLGPLNTEMQRVARANLVKPLSYEDRLQHARLSQERHEAVAMGDAERLALINRERIKLQFRGMFYNQELVDDYVDVWMEYDPYRNWQVNRIASGLVDWDKLWAELPRITSPVLVLYGYQDFEPITQAYQLKEHLADARPFFINECGHLPWIEQPEALRRALLEFLNP